MQTVLNDSFSREPAFQIPKGIKTPPTFRSYNETNLSTEKLEMLREAQRVSPTMTAEQFLNMSDEERKDLLRRQREFGSKVATGFNQNTHVRSKAESERLARKREAQERAAAEGEPLPKSDEQVEPDASIQPRPSLYPLAYRRSRFIFDSNYGFSREWRYGGIANWNFFVIGGFLAMCIYLEILSHPLENGTKVPEMPLTEYEKEQKLKLNDPNRVPWPLLHMHVTEIREGKRNIDEMQKLWEQTKFYYPGDWLIPIEIAQVMKYTSPKFMSQYVADPELMRKELLVQLLNVKYGKVKTVDRMQKESREIIGIAIDELRNMSMANPEEIPLVPTHSK